MSAGERIAFMVNFPKFVEIALVAGGSVTYSDYLKMDDDEANELLKAFNSRLQDLAKERKMRDDLDRRAERIKSGGY